MAVEVSQGERQRRRESRSGPSPASALRSCRAVPLASRQTSTVPRNAARSRSFRSRVSQIARYGSAVAVVVPPPWTSQVPQGEHRVLRRGLDPEWHEREQVVAGEVGKLGEHSGRPVRDIRPRPCEDAAPPAEGRRRDVGPERAQSKSSRNALGCRPGVASTRTGGPPRTESREDLDGITEAMQPHERDVARRRTPPGGSPGGWAVDPGSGTRHEDGERSPRRRDA